MMGSYCSILMLLLMASIGVQSEMEDLFYCPEGWTIRNENCYKFFNIKHSWTQAAEMCKRYGSNLMLVEDFSESNFTMALASEFLEGSSQNKDYWLGLMSLNDLTTNTLESASGEHVSLYAGFWAKGQPNVNSGECVKTKALDQVHAWELSTCEQLLPFMCRVDACAKGSKLCSNGKCINEAFFCDGDNDCGDMSDEMNCPNNCKYYMTSSTDSLESPNYPQKYNRSTSCKWTLEGPIGHNIIIQFNDFETESNFDTVQILTGGRTEDSAVPLVTLSGRPADENNGLIYESASNFMIVKFQTDGSGEKRGFRASWKTEATQCGGELIAASQPKDLISKNNPGKIPGGMECLYIIRAQPGRVITLDIQDIDMKPGKDYILIRDGSQTTSPELALLTGNKEENPGYIISTGSSLYIYVHTGLGETHSGYRIRYSSGCSVTITSNQGNITSPAYGISNYPNNQECDYIIQKPGGGRLSVKFNRFQIDEKDRLMIYDGSNVANAVRLHPGDGFSTMSPPKITLTSDSGTMLLRFITDPLRSNVGWSAMFSADCPSLNIGRGVKRSSLETAFGSEVQFTCADGQEFATNKKLITTKCMVGGNWSIDYIPDCQEVYCGPVPQIDNGFSISATNVTYLGQATYQCYAGFGFPSGDPVETISCTAEGKWDRMPECQASQCPELPETPNAMKEVLNGVGTNYGTVVRINCDPGYVRTGLPVVNCMSNGSWSGSVPICSKIQCHDFPEIENGFVTDLTRTYFFDEEARVQCHRGYKLVGSPVIKCGPMQQFIDLPQCQDIDECGTSQCDITSTECQNTPGAFFCQCKKGYEPNLDCRPMGDLGISDGGIPDDAIMTSSNAEGYDKMGIRLNSQQGWCGADPFPNNNYVTVDLKVPTVIHGLRIQPVRYQESLAFPSSIRLQYTDELTDIFREYADENGTAIEFRIATAASLHGINLPKSIEARYIRLTIAEFQIAPCLMFELMGCSRSGCTDKNECADNNGGCHHRCSNTPGGYGCSCENGFELYVKNGTAGFYIESTENGMRDGDTYRLNKTCVPKMCSMLDSVEHGSLLDTRDMHHFGDQVSFTCDFGYVMNGAESLACTSTGEWNGTIPTCIPATCEPLPTDPEQGLTFEPMVERVEFMENLTITCNKKGRPLRNTASSGFRQCVYDLFDSSGVYWLSGEFPSCERMDCNEPAPTPGAIYSPTPDTMYGSSFYFGCEGTFRLAGQSSGNDNIVRCMSDGNWDFGDLRCEGPVCSDPGHPADGIQIATSYEQGSKVSFECIRDGYIPITAAPITCIKEPECKIIKPLGITSGKIPDSAINATTERANYEARNIRLNSATGWCGMANPDTNNIAFITVDLGVTHRIKAILVKGVITNDVVGRPTEIRLFYKETASDKYTVYFPNFNLTAREHGNYGELAMITLPTTIKARFILLSVIKFDQNLCLKFELMGCEDEPASERLLGYGTGYPLCVDNSPPQFENCPSGDIQVLKGPNGILPVNFTVPRAYDNAGRIARTEVRPSGFQPPAYIFNDMNVEYLAFDFDGNVAICQINITVPDDTPPSVICPNSYVLSLVEEKDNYTVNFNTTLGNILAEDDRSSVSLRIMPDIATIRVGGYQNVTVYATDESGNQASCSFQVGVQASLCSDWGLKTPAHGSLSCIQDNQGVQQCTATCDNGYRFADDDTSKQFLCTIETNWIPGRIVPDCVSKDTQEANYDVTASVTYKANGAISDECLEGYKAEVAKAYPNLNKQLSGKCSSAVSLNIGVGFQDTRLRTVDDNLVIIDYVMRISSETKSSRIKDLYDLCSNTLSFIYDLGVPSASSVINELLNVPSTGNNCPSMRASTSEFTDGYTCSVGEILNTEPTMTVPRCLHCPAGSFADRGATKCSLCAVGYYQDQSRQGICKQCPTGTYTLGEGSKSEAECVPVCGYGTYSITGLVPCLNCPRNYFSEAPPVEGFKQCQACPPDTFTYREASYSQEFCRQLCSPGTYSETGLEPCYPCPMNFYQQESGATTCFECPTGNQTFEIRTTSQFGCQPVACTDGICKNGGLCLARQHQVQCYCPAGFTGRFCEVDINECDSQPCYNGGTCVDEPQSYRCICGEGYSGLQCQDERNDCTPDACPARAMCKDNPGIGEFECLCRSGYTGTNCNVTLNPCEEGGNPCQNEGACVPLEQGRFQCKCLAGWEGRTCEINTDDCSESPCLLNAECTDLVNDFSCECPPGFTGKRCQTKIDLCGSSPCMHGLCVDHFFFHECICDPGWNGESCDLNVNECEGNPCMNGGECSDDINGFKCECSLGYTGKRCQHEIDGCSSMPCQNGATCTDTLEGFTCECRPGYIGLRCDVAIDECQNGPCDPVGTAQCLDLDNMFKCKCHPGYTGELCETNINECSNEPCFNFGTCVDQVNDFECLCPTGWVGKRCEMDVGGCESNPCLNSAKCIDLFGDYFCVCPSGTDGKRCQVAPDRCVGDPCMHQAQCMDYGSGLNCSCSMDYTGVGCQYEFDACEEGVCQNGATCMDSGPGFVCQCPPGYTGTYCEEDIADCSTSSCPPGATCIDLTNDFYCQCSFNLTGEDCRKVINVDYELFLNDEAKTSSASLSTPFSFGRRTSFTIALWAQFATPSDVGTFLTLYEVSSPHMATDKKVLLQATDAGVAVMFGDVQQFVAYRTNIPLNDGQWHHLAIVWDGEASTLTLTTDAVVLTHTTEFAPDFIIPEFGWITLGAVGQEDEGYVRERGFHGRIARVNVWDRPLDFRIEIPKMVKSCKKAPVTFNGLVLRWNGYDKLMGNVERISPTTCGENICPPGYVGDCTKLKVDKTPPRFDHCPGDTWITAPNATVQVEWAEPKPTDNIGLNRMVEKSGYSSGQIFTPGSYQVSYVAYDDAGNFAECSFTIHVVQSICPQPEDPAGGIQSCANWGPGGRFKVCRIGCNKGLKFSTEVPDFYTCGPEGFWRPSSSHNGLVYPSCSPATPAQRVFKVKMQFPTSVICNAAGENVLKEKIRMALNKLNRDWNICTNTDETSGSCTDLDVGVLCARRNRITRSINTLRTKRQTSDQLASEDAYEVEITFASENDPVKNTDGSFEATVRDLIEKLILEDNAFDVRTALPSVVPDPSSLDLASEYSCPVGQVVAGSDCVPCAPGSYYSVEAKICIPCPLGTFLNELGQVQCTTCPEISGQPGVTEMEGSKSVEECKERCAAGRYFDQEAEECRPCGYGFYQPSAGQFSCNRCIRGQTTQTPEAVSMDECSDECESGFQLVTGGTCEMCSEGTYRTKGLHASCIACPEGRTTSSSGASSPEECNLPICLAGTFFDMENRVCLSCPEGTYQNQARQKTCMECPSGTWTRGKGSTSEKDCRNACAAQGDETSCDEFADCIEVENKKFVCKCKIGYLGNGTFCQDSCVDMCRNGGICSKRENGDPVCECEGSFTGPQCEDKSHFAYVASGIAGVVAFLIILVLIIWMICLRSSRKKETKKLLPPPSADPNGSQVNFFYGPGAAPYAESIAPSHHSTYAHYYDDEEDAWEMPNYYNESYAKTAYGPNATNSLARSNASAYGNKEDLYDRLRKHAYQGKKEKDETIDSDDQGR